MKGERKPSANSLLQNARLKHGWSQEELADLLVTTPVNISRWENGMTTPRPYFRQRLCEVFGKTIAELGLMPFTEGSRISSVPSKRNPFFTGRVELLEQLHRRLSTTGAAALTQAHALYGLGGIGKTQTALEYAFRYGNDYLAIFWIRAATRETLTTDFVKIARLLSLSEADEQNQLRTIDTVKRWLAANEGWLLIMDNADDLHLAQEFLPEQHNGSILFTTRDQAAGAIAESVEVVQLNLQDSILLLLHRSKRLSKDAPLDQAQLADRDAAERIAREMDGLPLALVQAAAYVEETKCSLADYLTLYATHRKDLLARRSRHLLDYPETVDTAWSISFQHIEEQSKSAADLLRLCAFLNPDAIPEDLFRRGAVALDTDASIKLADLFQLNEALDMLLRYSLVRRNSDTHILTIHRLVQTVIKEHMSQEMRRTWAERTVRLVNAAFPVENYGASTNLHYYAQYYLPHIQECAALIEQCHLYFSEAAQLLYQAGAFLYAYGLYPQSEALHRQALAIREQVVGTDDPTIAESLNYLAMLSRLASNYEQAESFYLQALTIREKTLGPEHLKTAVSLNNLGILYLHQGRYQEAGPLLQQALHIRQLSLGPEAPDTLTTFINLAKLYVEQEKYGQAEQMLKQTLLIIEQKLDKHPIIAQNLYLLAKTFFKQGHYEQAEILWQRAITAIEQLLGKEHPVLIESLDSLTELYIMQGRYIEAQSLCQRSLSLCEKKLGPEHPDTLTHHTRLIEIINKKSEGES